MPCRQRLISGRFRCEFLNFDSVKYANNCVLVRSSLANVGNKGRLYPGHWYTLFNPDLAMRNCVKKLASISAVVVYSAVGDKSVVVHRIKNKICQIKNRVVPVRVAEPGRAKKVVAAKGTINQFLAIVPKVEEADVTHESTEAVLGARIELEPLILVVKDFSRCQNGVVCSLSGQVKNPSSEMSQEIPGVSAFARDVNDLHGSQIPLANRPTDTLFGSVTQWIM